MDSRYHAVIRQEEQVLIEHYLMSGGNYQFCWHKPLELMLVLKGTVEVFANGRRYLLEEDDLLLINSNCGHSTFIRELDSLVLICELSPSFFRRYFSAEIGTLQIDCASAPDSRHSPLFTQARFLLTKSFACALDDAPLAKTLSIQYMTVLLGELMLHCPTLITPQKQGRCKEEAALQQVMRYVEANYDHKLTLEQVASHVQYNRTYLSTLFKKSTGILFNDYIIRVRLRRALEALRDLDRSILSVALDHGFPDSKSFSASMKKYCGRTPQEYRQALKQNPALKSIQETDKFLLRPDDEAEALLARHNGSPIAPRTGGAGPQTAAPMLEECCVQLESIARTLRRVL